MTKAVVERHTFAADLVIQHQGLGSGSTCQVRRPVTAIVRDDIHRQVRNVCSEDTADTVLDKLLLIVRRNQYRELEGAAHGCDSRRQRKRGRQR